MVERAAGQRSNCRRSFGVESSLAFVFYPTVTRRVVNTCHYGVIQTDTKLSTKQLLTIITS